MYHDCSIAPFYVTSYLVFNLSLNILIVLVLKHGSAAILAMSSTILVPIGEEGVEKGSAEHEEEKKTQTCREGEPYDSQLTF